MDDTTLKALEFPVVLGELATHAITPAGASRAFGLGPSSDISSIERSFATLSELASARLACDPLPVGGVVEIAGLLAKAAPGGASLSAEELIGVAGNIAAAEALKGLLKRGFREEYPLLTALIERLSDQEHLHSQLDRSFDDNGGIADGASAELRTIRRELRTRRERARSVLDAISRDARYADLLQEDIITIRDDRYVLCVKAEKSSSVGGVVHGRSGSGASFFVEPFEVVEFNNALAMLRKEERAEETRILRELTRMVYAERAHLVSDYETIGELDCLQARLLFSERIGARVPVLGAGWDEGAALDAGSGSYSGELKLLGARHPILALRESGGGPRAVPVDIVMDPGCRVLVISGANTGGKTVALKTLGLLTIMAASAIPVPVSEGSSALVFCDIFSDIGDSQDIASSLSTFSAHVKRLGGFVEASGPGSLVLVDEIGSGTNPAEGGALALAAIEELADRGARVVVTTHLNLLKAHAERDPGYRNASVEFDTGSFSPLYRLRYGVPGASLGLSIASTLGLPEALIERARGYLEEGETAFVESIASLAEEKAVFEEHNRRLATLESRRAEAMRRLEEKRGEILERARRKVDGIVSKARAEVAEAVRKAREAQKAARAAAPGGTGAPGQPSVKGLSAVVHAAGERARAALGERRAPYRPKPGDRAGIAGTATRGVVATVDADGERAELAVGAMKVWVPWKRLEPVEGTAPRARAKGHGTARRTGAITQDYAPSADMEDGPSISINVIGQRVEEARQRVTRFLDNAHAGGLGAVEIIHGVGTGALKKALEEMLEDVPYVRRHHPGDPDHGGAGVTVVVLD